MELLPDHQLIIDGDANVVNWDASVRTIEADFVMRDFNDDLTNLTPDHFVHMELVMPVADIEGDPGDLTEDLHEYLQKEEHPNITFVLDSIDDIQVNENSADITASGTITAAGVEHPVTLQVVAELDENSITFSGDKALLMTDFNIEPPTALLGVVRARDEMTIIYSVSFSK